MLSQPIDDRFATRRRVLVAGVGGGHDVVAGLAVAFALERRGHEVHLANLCTAAMDTVRGGTWLGPDVLRVDAAATSDDGRFPELSLARWTAERGAARPVWCFRRTGGAPLAVAYARLTAELGVDAVVGVDGGIDVVMSGAETSMGTPTIDALSVAAASTLELPVKVVAACAFGVERGDGICHAQVLRRFAELTRGGALLGVESLVAGSPDTDRWLDALAYVQRAAGPRGASVICSSLEASVRGRFGDAAVNARVTDDKPIWLSPLLPLVWFFDLDAVARAKPFHAELLATSRVEEAVDVVERYHERLKVSPERIPL